MNPVAGLNFQNSKTSRLILRASGNRRFNALSNYVTMSSYSRETPEETVHPDGQRVIVDGIRTSHFLMPPKRCKNRDD